jgi:hypothetical protein
MVLNILYLLRVILFLFIAYFCLLILLALGRKFDHFRLFIGHRFFSQ